MPLPNLMINLLKTSCTGLILYFYTGRIKAWILIVLFIGLMLIDFIFSELEANHTLFNDLYISQMGFRQMPKMKLKSFQNFFLRLTV